ncbi:MAG: SIS domain-containing protein [Nitrospirae bacterium]|nr:SIS domain-containing protein [Nitrospirota bacterium]
MLIAKSPVSISFGGEGTDLKPFCDNYGGAVISTTIDKYFYSVIQSNDKDIIEIESDDYQLRQRVSELCDIDTDDILMIPKAVLKHFNVTNNVSLLLKSDIPPGSGLGLSAAVTTCLVKLVSSFRQLSLTKAEIAALASYIEIDVLNRSIGMQAQYASAYGGFNFITFGKDSINVAPMGVDREIINALQENLLLFYSVTCRKPASILTNPTEMNDKKVISSLQEMKAIAFKMRDALVKGDVMAVGRLLHESWEYKRTLAKDISNTAIDSYYELARQNGAIGGKITGAGGGHLLLFCEKEKQENVRNALLSKGLHDLPFKFENNGAHLVLDQKGPRTTITAEGYLLGISTIVKKMDDAHIERIADLIYQAYKQDKQIFIMGNGGSAATASHFCSDLSKTAMVHGKRGFRVISLTDNIPLMTAWGNDTGYENIFYGQLLNLLNAGDVVIGISGGGMSKNVLKALELAKARSAVTIGLSGFSGGKLKAIADECLVVHSENYQFIEDIHMMLAHLIPSILKEKITNE